MKTILWATLTANGNYAQASPEHPAMQEALDDFGSYVKMVGNFIVGRRTFEGFNASGGGNGFGDIDIVVVSSQNLEVTGVTSVTSPEQALDFLKQKGHETALIAGGESLHNAFLAQGLVDELVFNIAPTLAGRGLNLVLPDGNFQQLRLIEVKDIGGGIVQLHYAVNGDQ